MKTEELIDLNKELQEAELSVRFGNTDEDCADVIVSYDIEEEDDDSVGYHSLKITNIEVQNVFFNENKGNYFLVRNFVLEDPKVIDLISSKY